MLTPREEIAELDALIVAHQSNISHVRNMLNNPDLAERLVAERRATIDKLLAEIAEISSVQIYGDTMIARSKARLVTLRTKRAIVVNNAGIQKLLEMAQQLNELKDESGGDLDIAAIVAEIDNEMDAEESDE
jgi:predicted component of type VI protein secretion system